MPEIDFNSLKNDVLAQVADLASGVFANRKDEIKQDAEEFLKDSEEKLKEWAGALAEGKLSKAELEHLVKGRADLLKMKLITSSGAALVDVDNLRQGILDIVVKVVSKTVL